MYTMLLLNRQNDLNGRRFRPAKYRHNALNKEIFTKYREKYKSEIEWSLFKNVIIEFNELFKEAVVTNREGARLPYIGLIALCSFKPRRRVPIDFQASNKTGLIVKHLNFDTDELACKLVYTSYYMKYRYQWAALWKFKGSRSFSRLASKHFRANHLTYKRLDLSGVAVSKLFDYD